MHASGQVHTFDELLDAIGHVRRRKLLRTLLSHNPQDDESLVIDSDESEDEGAERLIQMHQVHLPKLESRGLITWDQNNNKVSRGPNFEQIRPLLELLVAHEEALPTGEFSPRP